MRAQRAWYPVESDFGAVRLHPALKHIPQTGHRAEDSLPGLYWLRALGDGAPAKLHVGVGLRLFPDLIRLSAWFG